MHSLILLAALLAGAVLFACLSLRLRQVKRMSLRWFGAGLTGLIAIVLFLTCVAASVGHYKQYYSRRAPVPELRVGGSDEQIQRGRPLPTVSAEAAIHRPGLSREARISASICRPIWARSYRPI